MSGGWRATSTSTWTRPSSTLSSSLTQTSRINWSGGAERSHSFVLNYSVCICDNKRSVLCHSSFICIICMCGRYLLRMLKILAPLCFFLIMTTGFFYHVNSWMELKRNLDELSSYKSFKNLHLPCC